MINICIFNVLLFSLFWISRYYAQQKYYIIFEISHFVICTLELRTFKKNRILSKVFFKLVQYWVSQTHFMGSEFEIFVGFWWVHSSVLVDEPGFRKVRSSVFPDLGPDLAHFWLNRFKVQAFWRGSNRGGPENLKKPRP